MWYNDSKVMSCYLFLSCLRREGGAVVTVEIQKLGLHVCTVTCTNRPNKMKTR